MTVSVFIPAYNSTSEIREAVLSVKKQTYSSIRLYIVDDNSDEDIRRYLNGIDSYKYIRNEKNLGLVNNWNKCLKLCDTEYCLILHDDDKLHPKAIKILQGYLKENPDAAIAAGHSSSKLHKISAINQGVLPEYEKYESGEVSRFIQEQNSYLPCSSVLFRNSFMNNIGLFDNRYKYSADEELWPRILKKGYDICVSSEDLVTRGRDNNYSDKTWKYDDFIEQYKGLYSKIASHTGCDMDACFVILENLSGTFTSIGFKMLKDERDLTLAVKYYRQVNHPPVSRGWISVFKYYILSIVNWFFTHLKRM